MQVLKLRLLLGQGITDVHVIQLLTAHVKDVAVAFRLGDAGDNVEIFEGGEAGKGGEGGDVGELVEVTCGNDACVAVLGEDLGDEVLSGG